jgi:beta-ureidopropionase / N-carbamoyl-L-amino-acid hydrolase
VGELDVAALLGEIAGIGRDARRGGYSRHVFDEHEARLRAWFTGHAARLGLTVAPDGNGNLWAWWGDPGPGAVLTGSHLDSVPGGGAYDGPLGVASALAAVSRLRAAGSSRRGPWPSSPSRRRRDPGSGARAWDPGSPRARRTRRRCGSTATRPA